MLTLSSLTVKHHRVEFESLVDVRARPQDTCVEPSIGFTDRAWGLGMSNWGFRNQECLDCRDYLRFWPRIPLSGFGICGLQLRIQQSIKAASRNHARSEESFWGYTESGRKKCANP